MVELREVGIDPGKVRSLRRATTEDGFFFTCAIDHGDDYRALLDPNLENVPFERTVASKVGLVAALSSSVSSFLLDPAWSAAHAIVSNALPRDVGLMVNIERAGGYAGAGPRGETRFREGWSAAKVKRLGADVCKLLWFFRPDGDLCERQCDVVRALAEECASLSLPLMVEPIWCPLPGEDRDTEKWRDRRLDGIVESAGIAGGLGVDILKLEFPGRVGTESDRSKAAAACAAQDAGISVPWVILSAGVGFEDFKLQLELSCDAGASGFVAGRSVWKEAVAKIEGGELVAGASLALSRLDELGAVARKHGRPLAPTFGGDSLEEALPEDWYKDWPG